MPDYENVTKAYRAGKSAVTRAKNKQDFEAIVAACEKTFASFDQFGYPDDWAFFRRAANDAANACRVAAMNAGNHANWKLQETLDDLWPKLAQRAAALG